MKRIIAFLLALTLALGLLGAQAADAAALKAAANAGDTEAMYQLGQAYRDGDGAEQNYSLAAYWYQMAAEKGHAPAMYYTGVMFYYGYGMEQNYQEAMKWFKKSADSGYSEAQIYIGVCYMDGSGGLSKDEQKARDLFIRSMADPDAPGAMQYYFSWDMPAAECFDSVLQQAYGGSPAAMCDAGYMYYYGWGTQEDNVQAANMWYNAADRGVPLAMFAVAHMFCNGFGTAQNTEEVNRWIGNFVSSWGTGQASAYTRNYTAQATQEPTAKPIIYDNMNTGSAQDSKRSVNTKAAEVPAVMEIDPGRPRETLELYGIEALVWAANEGDLDAAYILGWCYWYGVGVAQDDEEAFAWFYTLAADEGDPRAYIYVGNACYLGRGTQQDYAEALKWYLLAAEEGDNIAMGNAADIYNYGRGNVPQDLPRAFALYKQSAELGNVASMGNLGVCYINGRGTSKNTGEGVKWITKAAENGNAQAMYNMGQLYENGLGVKKNASTARSWYEKAAAAGNAEAKKKLGE